MDDLKRYLPDSPAALAAMRPTPGKSIEYVQDRTFKPLQVKLSNTGRHVYVVRGTNWENKQVRERFGAVWNLVPVKDGDTVDGLPIFKSLKEAREMAQIKYAQLRIKPAETLTLGRCLKAYLEGNEDHSEKTSNDYRRLAEKHLYPYFHFDVRTEVTSAWLDDLKHECEKPSLVKIRKTNPDILEALLTAPCRPGIDPASRYLGVSQTARLMMLLRGMYSSLNRRGEVDVNPFDRLTKNRAGKRSAWLKRPRARKDIIPLDKIAAFVHAGNLVEKSGRISVRQVLLEMLTGFRSQAIVSLKLSQIDLAQGSIRVNDYNEETGRGDPGQKGRDAILFPLGPWALQIVKDQVEHAELMDSEWLFPARNEKDRKKGLHRKADIRGTLNKMKKAAGVQLKGTHDLRRTFATYTRPFVYGDEVYWKKLMGHALTRDETTQTALSDVYIVTMFNELKPVVEDFDNFMSQCAGRAPVTAETKKIAKRFNLTAEQIEKLGRIQ